MEGDAIRNLEWFSNHRYYDPTYLAKLQPNIVSRLSKPKETLNQALGKVVQQAEWLENCADKEIVHIDLIPTTKGDQLIDTASFAVGCLTFVLCMLVCHPLLGLIIGALLGMGLTDLSMFPLSSLRNAILYKQINYATLEKQRTIAANMWINANRIAVFMEEHNIEVDQDTFVEVELRLKRMLKQEAKAE